MNKLFRSKYVMGVLMFLSTIALSCIGAQAQITTEVDANIPFTFTAGSTRLPAGSYVLTQDSVVGPIVELKSADGSVGVLLDVESAQTVTPPKTSELVFDKIGNKDFLREIWVADADFGYRMAKTRQEKELEGKGMKAVSHRVKCVSPSGKTAKSGQTGSY